MPEMGLAAGTTYLFPNHAVGVVHNHRNILLGDRLVEARPSCTGVELRIRVEQRSSAADAGIDASFMVGVVLPCERAFRARAAGYFELFRRELLPPLVITLFDLLHFLYSCLTS